MRSIFKKPEINNEKPAVLRGGRFSRLLILNISTCLLITNAQISIAKTVIKPGKRLHFEKINTEKGLPSNHITSIVQDSIGFMWFATRENGLCRYDGNEIVTYHPEDSVATSLTCQNIKRLFIDSKGALWIIGSVGDIPHKGCIDKYDPLTNGFIHILSPNDSIPSIIDIAEDRLGNFYFSVTDIRQQNNQILKAFNQNGSYQIKKISPLVFNDNSVLPANYVIHRIINKGDGKLLLGLSQYGIVEYDINTGRVNEDDFQNLNYYFNRFSFKIDDILLDCNQNLWIAAHKFLAKYSIADGSLQYYLLPLKPDGSEINPYQDPIKNYYYYTINQLYEGSGGQIWVVGSQCNQNETFFRYDPETEIFWHYSTDPYDENQISVNNINCFFIDKSGSAWLATQYSGVFRFSLPRPFMDLRSISDSINFNNDNVNDVLEDHENNLWFGLKGKVLRYNPKTKNVKIFPLKLSNQESPPPGTLHIYEDSQNTIWVGTTLGLFKLNPSSQEFIYLNHVTKNQPNKQNSIRANHIPAIYEDHQGNFWLGTAAGLCRYDRQTNQRKYYSISEPTKNVPNKNIIYDILEDRNNNLWLATRNGLILFDRKTGTYQLISDSTLIFMPESDEGFYRLYEAQDGQIWLTSSLPYLISYNPLTKKFVYRTENSGYIWKYPITGVIEDHNGIFWCRTTQGIIKHNPILNTFTLFDRNDNVNYYYKDRSTSDIREPSYLKNNILRNYCRLRSGWIMIGGKCGYTYFHPDSINNKYVPNIVITKFKNDYTEKIISNHSPNQITLDLPWNENYFTISFSLLDYYIPAENKYYYILEGYDKDWKKCVKTNSVSYSKVPPGQYTFRVKGENSDGVLSRNEATIRIKIVPPFWKTAWFKILIWVLGLGVVVLINYIRIAVIRHQKEELEKQVVDRTQALIEKSKALEAAHNQLEEKVQERTQELAEANVELNREINIRMKAEESLKRSEEVARVLLNAPIDLAMLIDPDGNILAANNSVLKHFQASENEVINHNLSEFSPPNLFEHQKIFLDKCTNTQSPQEFEDENRGRIFHYHFYPIIGMDQKVNNIAIYIRDITDQREMENFLRNARSELEKQVNQRTAELRKTNRQLLKEINTRKKIENKLRASEEKYRDLFQNANDLIWTMDKTGKFLSVNNHFKNLSGYSKKELFAINPLTLIHPEHQFRIIRCYLKVLTDGPTGTELNVMTKSGEIRPIWLKMRPIMKNNQIIGIHGIGRDITEIRHAQQELRESEEQKRESMRQFILKLAHEVKNPLASIKSSAQLVASMNNNHNPQVEKHMDIINRNVDTCNKVIRDLFSYAHATNYQFEEVNAAKFIKSINDFIEEKLNEYPYIKISVNYDRDLPPIYIDEFRLTQAFQNIINNAFEAMTKKGRFTLNVKALKTEKQVQFLFTDTGSGIPAEDLPQIFQSFYSSKSKGFGLGLALTKEIIEFHHGKISVNSILHHGTTFKVTIPAVP